MSPVWMIEGGATATAEPPPEASERREAERMNGRDPRLAELAAAVREHEISGRHEALPARPQDLALYRRLRQICAQR